MLTPRTLLHTSHRLSSVNELLLQGQMNCIAMPGPSKAFATGRRLQGAGSAILSLDSPIVYQSKLQLHRFCSGQGLSSA